MAIRARGFTLWLSLASACGSDVTVFNPCVHPDEDGDGDKKIVCGGQDCDDTNWHVHPGASEVCDTAGLDEDCDPSTYGVRDADADRFNDAHCCNGSNCGPDCDDSNASTHPSSVEACDQRDNDCDGATDEGVLVTAYTDQDGDGFGVGEASSRCAGEGSFAGIAGDCDDTKENIHPGAFRCSTKADAKSSDIEVCQGDARWKAAACAGLGTCVVQPDTTGVCLPGEGTPECADGEDNDKDGLSDFADPDCTSAQDDSEKPLACADGVDQDMDHWTDYPDDPGCDSREDDSEDDPATLPACANGLDDDGDGATDYVAGEGDQGCDSASDQSERNPDGPTCDNGLDDDMDGASDYPADKGCLLPQADTEQKPACSNGIDDDHDGLIDFGKPNDPGCDSETDNSERGPNGNFTCDNGIDDDKNGVADYPGDANCTSVFDTEP